MRALGGEFTEDHEFYKNPLYYDIVFDGDISDEVDVLQADVQGICRRSVKRACQPACGNGFIS